MPTDNAPAPAPATTPRAGGDLAVVGQVRTVDSGLPLPEGWITTEIWWDGEHRELAYDPSRYTVIQARPGTVDDHLRADLGATGWRHFGTDSQSCELWVLDRAKAAISRLDRLRQREMPGHEALFVS